MYQLGLGECFLLTFPRFDGGEFHVLINCGTVLGTPYAGMLLREVAHDIANVTSLSIDVLVITVMHWDHISGFVDAFELFRQFHVGEVWMAWTEDPQDATAERLMWDRDERLATLYEGTTVMQNLSEREPEAGVMFEQVAGHLAFAGHDSRVPPRRTCPRMRHPPQVR